MTQIQGEPALRRCPRCGGLMARPAGSLLYWHADNNHPRCDITNIVDLAGTLPDSTETVETKPQGGGKRKK